MYYLDHFELQIKGLRFSNIGEDFKLKMEEIKIEGKKNICSQSKIGITEDKILKPLENKVYNI